MERQQVIVALESLANGTDPATGAEVSDQTYRSAETARALFAAAALLKAGAEQKMGQRVKTTLTAAGTPWSGEEDARLGQEFDAGMTIAQIALQHGRTSGAITSRLVKLGRIDPATVKVRERGARIAS